MIYVKTFPFSRVTRALKVIIRLYRIDITTPCETFARAIISGYKQKARVTTRPVDRWSTWLLFIYLFSGEREREVVASLLAREQGWNYRSPRVWNTCLSVRSCRK